MEQQTTEDTQRLTCEVDVDLYRRLKAAAFRRGDKGYREIVEAAVKEYLDRAGEQ